MHERHQVRQVQARGVSNMGYRGDDGKGLPGVRDGMSQQGVSAARSNPIQWNQSCALGSLGNEPQPGLLRNVRAMGDVDLLELSPPRPAVSNPMGSNLGSIPLSAMQNSAAPQSDAQHLTNMLRGYDVDHQTGLRGVQLAYPRREREPVPVIHMPEREYGALSEPAPPPSLDLLGLDPIPIQGYQPQGKSDPVPPLMLAPCAPDALSPFVLNTGVDAIPAPPHTPMPPRPFESPRSTVNTSRSSYTPGGTRIPDGPPPVTPRQVSFSPTVDYSHVEGMAGLPVYEGIGPYGNVSTTQAAPQEVPVPPFTLPPPMPTQGGGVASGLGQGQGLAIHPGMAVQGCGHGSGLSMRIEEPSRLVYHLPPLSVEPGTQDASVAAGDWVARVRPVLTTLSSMVGLNSPCSGRLLPAMAGRRAV